MIRKLLNLPSLPLGKVLRTPCIVRGIQTKSNQRRYVSSLLLASLGFLTLQQQSTSNSDLRSQPHIDPEKQKLFLSELIEAFQGQYIDENETMSKVVHQSNQDEGELQSFAKVVQFFHSQDRNSYHETEAPICIFYPLNTSDVRNFLKICNKHKICVVPFNKGTSLEGGVLPMSSLTAVINLSQMNKIIRFMEQDMQIEVEPALGWMELNDFLKDHDLFFPVDPGPGAGIGGMVSTNCSGTNAFRYGTMRDWVVNVELVLPDGSILQTAQRSKKSSAGYNLTRKQSDLFLDLVVGSEGTLGVVTKITLKLVKAPKTAAVVTICFDSLQDLCHSVHQLIMREVPLGCIELMDKAMINMLLERHDMDHHKKSLIKDSNLLMLKIQGEKSHLPGYMEAINEIILKNNGKNIISESDHPDAIWDIRKRALWIVNQQGQLKKGKQAQVWTTDVCVPISQLADQINLTQRQIQDQNLIGPIIGHVGDGNYHVLFVVDYKNEKEWNTIRKINEEMVHRAIEVEGTCTGEHGVGIGKREFVQVERGPKALDIMKQIKKVFDPNGIMNPGKVFSIN